MEGRRLRAGEAGRAQAGRAQAGRAQARGPEVATADVDLEEEDEGLLATLALPALAEHDQERLDRFVVARLQDMARGALARPDSLPEDHRVETSRAEVQRWIEEGRVRIGLRPLRNATKVRQGETVLVDLARPAPPAGPLRAEAIAVPILHQDEELLVLDKPAGMPVHPGAGRATGTLANALLHASAGKLSTLGGPDRPGIVHRLDMDTSGAIVVARTDHAHRHLSDQFARRLVDKEYVALVEGSPDDDGVIDAPIGRHPRDRKKMAIVASGRHALTRWRVVERFEAKKARFALLAVKIETGRTHQIRVHCTSRGFPIAGDQVYGRASKLIARQALHAAKISLDHPSSGERLSFEAKLPEDITRALEALRAGRDEV